MTFRFEGDVPEFARHAIHAVPDFSPQHNATADAGSQGEHGHIRDATGSAQPLLAESGNARVVLEDHAGVVFRESQAALDFRAGGIVFPAGKVGRLPHHSGLQVDEAGNADAGAEKLSGLLVLAG